MQTTITEYESTFHLAKPLVEANYNRMVGSGLPLLAVECDRDVLWLTYLSAFPTADQQTEHRCSACRQFIKTAGVMVTINEDLTLTTIWDVEDAPEEYAASFTALAAFVRSCPIEGLFHHVERTAGVDKNLDRVRNRTWTHFFARIPTACINTDNVVGRNSGVMRESVTMLQRALTEITSEAVSIVQELIAQGSIYRGDQHKASVDALGESQRLWASVPDAARELWLWRRVQQVGEAFSRVRNQSIGKLLVDLSEGMEMEQAVASYERITAPGNYMRPTALVTPRMLDQAKARLQELGLMSALDRRRLDTRDLTAANALFLYRPTAKAGQDVFAQLKDETPPSLQKLDKVEEVHVDKFIADILPSAQSVRVLLERQHLPNLVTLIGPCDPEAKSLMAWDNSFGWSYSGGVADAIKERVRAAKGRVDNVWLRASLGWSNYDDLDLHLGTAGSHVFYNNKKGPHGELDVDMNAHRGTTREPVENIFMPDQPPAGSYQFSVNQFMKRETNDTGFTLDIEVGGEVRSFSMARSPSTGNSVSVVVSVDKDGQVTFRPDPELSSVAAGMTKWGLTTGLWHRVRAVTLSPNHWTQPQGVKHLFFLLENCISDERPRPFYNEFLTQDLAKDRKVCEVLASKIEVAPADGVELSGLGFISTARNHLYVELEGSFKRTLKVLF